MYVDVTCMIAIENERVIESDSDCERVVVTLPSCAHPTKQGATAAHPIPHCSEPDCGSPFAAVREEHS